MLIPIIFWFLHYTIGAIGKKKELFLYFKMSKRLPVNLRNVSKAVSHSLSDLLPFQPVYVSRLKTVFSVSSCIDSIFLVISRRIRILFSI